MSEVNSGDFCDTPLNNAQRLALEAYQLLHIAREAKQHGDDDNVTRMGELANQAYAAAADTNYAINPLEHKWSEQTQKLVAQIKDFPIIDI